MRWNIPVAVLWCVVTGCEAKRDIMSGPDAAVRGPDGRDPHDSREHFDLPPDNPVTVDGDHQNDTNRPVDRSSEDSMAPADSVIETCTSLTERIALGVQGDACTALIRLSTIDLTILGWSLDCGPRKVTTEADARVAFSPWAGANSPAASYDNVGGPSPMDGWVFFRFPGDFGGVAVVSAATGRPLFLGGLVWSSVGTIRYPGSFRGAWELSPMCTSKTLPHPRGVPGAGLDVVLGADLLTEIVAQVATTPVVPALSENMEITSVLVVPYQADAGYRPGPTTPLQNEWIVFINGSAP